MNKYIMDRNSEIRLSLQRALIGHISNGMSAVRFEHTGDNLDIIFYFTHIDNENTDPAEDVVTEVMADQPQGVKVRYRFTNMSDLENDLVNREGWVFLRYGI